ncbi:MAG: hypothetical protein ACRD0L_14915 [Acidimicrobiales bacterium]
MAGTAVSLHVGHRVSGDLDFFLDGPVDLAALEATLADRGPLAVTQRAEGTLSCILRSTKLQFLDASSQHMVDAIYVVEGIRVAGIGDVLASKLKVVVDHPELRDYLDIQVMEQRTGRTVEEGLGLFLERYRPVDPDAAVRNILRALVSFDDVPEDPALEVTVEEMRLYWMERLPAIVAHLDRWGEVPPTVG